jgi:DnaA family protein
VVDYLCARASRALPDLLAILDRLDSASLERKRAVTVPLVRDVMGW